MDALNLRVLVDLSGGYDPDEIKKKVEAIDASPYKDRFRVFANVNWENAGAPGWQEKALADLRQTSEWQLRYFNRDTWVLIIIFAFPFGPFLYLACGKQ